LNFLSDTHLLIWSAGQTGRLSPTARWLLADPANKIYFSTVSIWEVAIKARLGRSDFEIDPTEFTQGLIANGFLELPVTRQHALAVYGLPTIHKDPFDRLLIAQAQVEGLTLLTHDDKVALYPGPIRKV
jgi:PIN domain nuclease of toxin-antitoxin system